ncbi:hypothetical protein PCANC_11380 [Puccinia coronata f. sp. avenae]|uniref:Uncharacterized protein n=1 Tax=Puccinia coronata f. sp. avenae TaxID=200324 RepID=A0A2N5SUX2_9BASI|nr:hypothetical protein PCANC_11380 [Puccinia coronata f. sp. avenae]
MSKEWRAADTLKACMELATEAAAQLDLLSLLPPETLQSICHRPLSSAPPPGLHFPPTPSAVTSPGILVTHMGSLNCLNAPVSLEKRLAFKPDEESPIGGTNFDLSALAEYVMGDYQNYDEEYEDYGKPSNPAVNVPVNTVQVCLDCSKGNCLTVPALFNGPNGNRFTANILVDAGAMAKFVSKEFVQRHNLKL